jgi:phosphate starvation-inducible PhoH-like protein
VLDGIPEVHFSYLTSADVVRHSLVGRIVDAYTKYDAERQAQRFERQQADGEARGGANREERRAPLRRGRNPQNHRRKATP